MSCLTNGGDRCMLMRSVRGLAYGTSRDRDRATPRHAIVIRHGGSVSILNLNDVFIYNTKNCAPAARKNFTVSALEHRLLLFYRNSCPGQLLPSYAQTRSLLPYPPPRLCTHGRGSMRTHVTSGFTAGFLRLAASRFAAMAKFKSPTHYPSPSLQVGSNLGRP